MTAAKNTNFELTKLPYGVILIIESKVAKQKTSQFNEQIIFVC